MSLRVITGKRRGHKLKGPRSSDSRPTEDRMKESLFNILEPIEEDSVVFDAFACTGNIGIEFLSRGSKKAYFSEINKNNIKDLNDNLEHTKFTEQAVVLEGDVKRNLLHVNENIDYIYIDPPYDTDLYSEALEIIEDLHYFNDSLIIIETNQDINFSEKFDYLDLVYEKKYGKKFIRFYRRKDESSLSR